MKKLSKTLWLMAGLAFVSGFFLMMLPGCDTAGGIYAKTETVEPATVETIVTNQTVEVVTDPASGLSVTNVSEIIETNLSQILITNRSFAVSSNTVTYIETAKAVNAAVPSPWQTPITIGLTLISGILGIVARVKSNKAALLPIVISGVEAAGNTDVKKSIAHKAEVAGKSNALWKLVQSLT